MDGFEGSTRSVVERDAGSIEERGRAASGATGAGTTAVTTATGARAVWPLATTSSAAATVGGGGPRPGSGDDARIGRCARLALAGCARVACAGRRVHRGATADGGAATAEYAIATMAAVAFAGLLVVILQSDEVRGLLLDLVRRALTYDR
ncbi:DUF4244 domain-containing protein [Clavibacter zhangzhiyongii]|uniref:DUF4244 domain-containing protein n=1 Tax=Clavibacter zhangzhiyongii TaxID=2768071 RepID=UPI0039DF997E